MIYHLSWEEMGAGSEYPLLWSLPISVFLSSDVPRAELWKLWGCPHAGCDLFGVPGYINDLVLSLHRDDSAQGTSCSWDLKWHSQLCQGRTAVQVLLHLPRASCRKLKRRQGEGIYILHLLAFIFWLLVVAILSLNLF